MSDSPVDFSEYIVIYSGRVLQELNSHMMTIDDPVALLEMELALAALDHRLRVYPQFGQPLRNLQVAPLQIWVACVAPLVVHYILDEERRTVSVVVPFQWLPKK